MLDVSTVINSFIESLFVLLSDKPNTKYIRGSQKIRFPVLMPTNNFT
jgi:hypothetical protein